MQTKKLVRVLFLVVSVMMLTLVGMTVLACVDPDKDVEGPENGVYYTEVGTEEWKVTLSKGKQFTFEFSEDTSKSGKYKLEEGILTFDFSSKDEDITATLVDDVISLTWEGTAYRFLRDVNYTVTFTAAGKTVETQTVRNGKAATKPAVEPENGDEIFVGWYTDGGFSTEYEFGQPVRGDISVHGRFVAPIDPEFIVKIDWNYPGAPAQESVETIGNKVFGVEDPTRTGYTFAGWWVSDFESASKLTYRYEEQELDENTTLYAVWKENGDATPLVSVNESGVTWTASGIAGNYQVTITAPDGSTPVNKESTGAQKYSFDFSEKAEGEYRIDVTFAGKTGTAYYNNKALARVSVFKVEGNKLTWNAIEGAEGYTVSATCGTEGHDHVNSPVEVTNASYDFGACDMLPDGMVFKITAHAKGMVSSVSREYTFERTLNGATGISVAADTQILTWNAVESATSYEVKLTANGETVTQSVAADARAISLKGYDKTKISIEITPKARGWNSPTAATFAYDKPTIASPTIRVVGYEVVWDDVAGATSYEITVNGVKDTTQTASYTLTEDASVTSYAITVRAIAQDTAASSIVSDVLTVSAGEMTTPTYTQSVVSWDPVFGAKSYFVKVNAGGEISVSINSLRIELTQKGENTIDVCAVLRDGSRTEWKSVTVTAYMVEFDTTGAAEGKDTLYLADGDPVEFGAVSRRGYEFAGWYTAEGGAAGTGKRFDDAFFTNKADITLFAAWNANKYNVKFVVDSEKGLAVDPVNVTFGSREKLPVPKTTDPEWVFLGWYLEPNGGSTRYSDFAGECVLPNGYDVDGTVTLNAYFGEAFSWEQISGQNAGWRISKSTNSMVQTSLTEITIPETHNGQPVTEVNDFRSLANLVRIRIPSTIKYINIASDGIAFSSCKALESIEIYPVEGQSDQPIYFSDKGGGALYQNASATGSVNLIYAPTMLKGDNGVYTVLKPTTRIIAGAFSSNSEITELVISSTVTSVETNSIKSLKNLRKITFLEAEEGEPEQQLSIGSEAFTSLTVLDTIVFSTRLQTLPFDFAKSCGAITTVTTNEAGDESLGGYTSVDGLLCKAVNGGKELVYVPAGVGSELIIPDGVTSVGTAIFGVETDAAGKAVGTASTFIEKVVISGSVTKISRSAFRGNGHLKEIVFEGNENDDALTIEDYAFYGAGITSGYYLTQLTLPENLLSLGAYAFGNTQKLVTVKVNSKGVIGTDSETYELKFAANAFATKPTSATTLPTFYVTELDLGEKVPYFDILAVFGSKVAKVDVDTNNPNFSTSVGDGVLYDKAITSIAFYPSARQGAYTVPETVKYIPQNTFSNKTNLTEITIGSNVIEIGAYAFYNCSNLSRVVFKSDGTEELTIGDCAFASGNTTSSQNKITNISLPERTVSIGSAAFRNGALTSIKLPATLREIRASATSDNLFDTFENCYALAKIDIAQGNPYYGASDDVIYSMSDGQYDALIFAPLGKTGTVTVPETVREVKGRAFYNNTEITKVEFKDRQDTQYQNDDGETVTGLLPLVISAEAFYQCKGLGEVILPRGLVSIASKVFYNCVELKTLTIPNTVASIAPGAFEGCTGLSSLIFAEGNEDLELVFEDGTYHSYYAEEYGTYYGVGGGTFKGCSSLKEFTMPARAKRISISMFSGSGVRTVTLHKDVTEIATDAFYLCESLETVVIPEGSELQTIGANAFAMSTLKTIDLMKATKLNTIGGYAFWHSALTDVEIPGSVSEIGKAEKYKPSGSGDMNFEGYTFTYAPLSSIVIHDGVEAIRSCSFEYLSGDVIEEVRIPASVSAIDTYAFANSYIKKIIFKDNSQVERIANYAFYNNPYLETLDFGKNSALKVIGTYAFQKDSRIQKVVIPANVQYIMNGAFYACSGIKTLEWEKDDNGKLKTSSLAMIGCTESNNTFKVATSGANVFRSAQFESIVFPESTAEGGISLGAGIFFGCSKLNSVTFSKDITSLTNPFQGCASITTVVIPEENENFKTEEGIQAIFDGQGSPYLVYGEFKDEFVFPEGSNAQNIGTNAFKGQVSLTRIVLPKSVRTIDANAFTDCISLTEVVIPQDSMLTEIGNYAFDGCTSLKIDLTNATGLTKIGNYAFRRCAFTELVLPASLQEIGTNTFQNNAKLTAVTLAADSSLAKLGNYAFDGCPQLASFDFANAKKLATLGTYLFRGSALVEADLTATAVKALGNYDFNGCEKLTTVKLPDTINGTLGTYTFQNCTSLETVEFGEGKPTIIGTFAFANTALTSFVIPKTITQVAAAAFAGSKNLSSVTFEEGGTATMYFAGTTASNGAFADTAVEELAFPDRPVYLANYAFYNCASLKRITDWGGVTDIGQYAFAGTGFEEIELPAVQYRVCSSTSITDTAGASANVFNGCQNLTRVTFAKGFDSKYLGASFFTGCPVLEMVDFTNAGTLEFLGDKIFQNCPALVTVYLSPLTKLNYIGGSISFSKTNPTGKITAPTNTASNYTFDGCTALQTVILPENLTHIGGYVFNGCSGLTEIKGANDLKGIVLIAQYAFAGTTSLQSIKFPADSALAQLGKYAFAGSGIKEADLAGTKLKYFNNGATSFGTDAIKESHSFEDCAELTTVKLPETLTQIGTYTFANCGNLNEDGIDLSNVTDILSYAFLDTGFKTLKVSDKLASITGFSFLGCDITYDCSGSTKYKIEGDCLMNDKGEVILRLSNAEGTGTFTIANDSEMYGYMYAGVKADKLILAEGVTKIPDYAFYGSEIKEIEIPTSLTWVGGYAFYGSHFKEVVLGEDIDYIDHYAFAQSYIDTIDLSQVNGANRDKYNSATREYEGGVFGYSNSSGSSLGSTSTRTQHLFEGSHAKTILLPPNLYFIGDYWFKDTDQLESLEIPDSLGYLTAGTQAFVNSNIREVTIPGNATSYYSTSSGAIFKDSKLEHATVKGGQVYPYIFQNATELSEVTLTDGVNTIGDYAFDGCAALTEIELPKDLIKLGTSAFRGTSLQKVAIPAGVTSIGTSAFQNCTSLVNVDFGNVTSIGISAFRNTRLTKVVIPETVTSVSSTAFAENPALLEAVCNYTSADNFSTAFQTCENLAYLKLPKEVSGIVGNAFLDCPKLNVWIPSSCASLTTTTFSGWGPGQKIYFEASKFEVYSVIGSEWLIDVGAQVEYGKTEAEFLSAIGRAN